MSKAKAVFEPEIEAYVGVAFPKTEAGILYNKLSNYQAMEELGRQAVFMARAQLRAAKNNTTVEEEYKKLVQNYERGVGCLLAAELYLSSLMTTQQSNTQIRVILLSLMQATRLMLI